MHVRGWGRSVTTPENRGRTGPTELVISDIHSFLTSINDSLQPAETDKKKKKKKSKHHDPIAPSIFLLGHSMGGSEVLYYMLNSPQFPPWIRGVLAYSPMVAMSPSMQPSRLTMMGAKLAAKILPNQHFRPSLDPYLMCRDTQVCEDWKDDPLCHNIGTLEGLFGMLERAAWLNDRKPRDEWTLALTGEAGLWVGHGTADRFNDFGASKRLVEVIEMQDKSFKAYEGGFHKLHGEPDGMKEALAKDIAHWILKRCDHVKHKGLHHETAEFGMETEE